MRNAWPEIKEVYALQSETELIPNGHFVGARFEQSLQSHEFGYDIMWFIWNRDGILPREDWEPIIFFWKGTRLIAVTTRPHFEWRDYSAEGYGEPNFQYPMRIVFRSTYHAAFVATLQWVEEFDLEITTLKKLKYRPTAIAADDVPDSAKRAWFKKKGLWIQFGEDIHDKADQRLEDLIKRTI